MLELFYHLKYLYERELGTFSDCFFVHGPSCLTFASYSPSQELSASQQEELQQRAVYLRQQRDKLHALKKEQQKTKQTTAPEEEPTPTPTATTTTLVTPSCRVSVH